jgi:hypothetical protein
MREVAGHSRLQAPLVTAGTSISMLGVAKARTRLQDSRPKIQDATNPANQREARGRQRHDLGGEDMQGRVKWARSLSGQTAPLDRRACRSSCRPTTTHNLHVRGLQYSVAT